ncbi:MAG: sulfur carrier protein ThiS [Deltaproteobacteria bacterium]|nr:sulfur carrier protein ThiS [Deltaproteobacteria bacterium]
MKLRVNGEEREVPEDLTIETLLTHLEVRTSRVAVEKNRTIVPKSEYAGTTLREGDELEIVSFVGGG